MTQAMMIEQVYERMPDIVNNQGMEPGAVRQALNLSYQTHRMHARVVFSEFYVRKQTFSTTTSLALPADCQKVLHIEAPLALRGSARELSHREYENVNMNPYGKGQTASPVYVVNATTIEFTPTTAGILYYEFNFGFISDDATEITDINASALALLPSIYEEEIIMEAMRILRDRYNEADAVPTTTAEDTLNQFVQSERMKEVLTHPLVLHAQDTMQNTLPKQPPQQQWGPQ